jgi:hypothetical protein
MSAAKRASHVYRKEAFVPATKKGLIPAVGIRRATVRLGPITVVSTAFCKARLLYKQCAFWSEEGLLVVA